MWGLGCIVAFLFFGTDVFPDTSEYDWMKSLLHWLGQPDDELISAGEHSWSYFTLDQDAGWRLNTPDEYEDVTGVRPLDIELPSYLGSLEEAVMRWPHKPDDHEYEERMAFSDFLKCCLNVNAGQRMTPSEALNHRFITMASPEQEKESNSNTGTSFPDMNVPSPCCGDEPLCLSEGEDCPEEDSNTKNVVSFSSDINTSREQLSETYCGEQDGEEAATSDCHYDADVEVSRDEAENSEPSVDMCEHVDGDFSVSSNNDASAAIGPVDGEDHKTASGGARRKKPFHSISKFFRRMQKGVASIFKPLKNNLQRKG